MGALLVLVGLLAAAASAARAASGGASAPAPVFELDGREVDGVDAAHPAPSARARAARLLEADATLPQAAKFAGNASAAQAAEAAKAKPRKHAERAASLRAGRDQVVLHVDVSARMP